jgi:hypothetical protein
MNVAVDPFSILRARLLPTAASSRSASKRENSTVTVACAAAAEPSLRKASRLTSSE